MIEVELSVRIRLACQRALWGAITPNIRMITVGWDDLKLFHLRIYFSSVPSDDEIEEMEAVSAEVLSDLNFLRDKVECIVDNRIRKDLEILKEIIYVRKE